MLDDRQISAMMQRFYAFELEEENKIRLSGVEFDEANRQAIVEYYDRVGAQVREALARNELERASNWLDAMLQREAIPQELDEVTRAQLLQSILRVSCEVMEAMKGRYEGRFIHQPKDPLLQIAAGEPLVTSAARSVGVVMSALILHFFTFAGVIAAALHPPLARLFIRALFILYAVGVSPAA